MLTCKELTEIVTDYLEGQMSFWQRAQFHFHLGMCKHCRAYVHQMKLTVRATGQIPTEPIPPDIKTELLQRLSRMKRPSDPN